MPKSILSVQYYYEKHSGIDCLFGNNLGDPLASDGSSQHYNCVQWCNDNRNCGGFAVAGSTCYFKGPTCRDNLKGAANIDVFLKLGS